MSARRELRTALTGRVLARQVSRRKRTEGKSAIPSSSSLIVEDGEIVAHLEFLTAVVNKVFTDIEISTRL